VEDKTLIAKSSTVQTDIRRLADLHATNLTFRANFGLKIREGRSGKEIGGALRNAANRMDKELGRPFEDINFSLVVGDAIVMRFLNDAGAALYLRPMIRKLREKSVGADPKSERGTGAREVIGILGTVAKNCGKRELRSLMELSDEIGTD